MTDRKALALACILTGLGLLLISVSACGTETEDAGIIQPADAGPDETHEACRDYLSRYAYGLECSPMGVEYDVCAQESDSRCYRPDYWRCKRRGLGCRGDTITSDSTGCETDCVDRAADDEGEE